MNICFLDQTSFAYNSKDINSYSLRGAETVLLNLAKSLVKLNNNVTIINNCPKNETISNIQWMNINHLNKKLIFDLAVSNNDCRLFDKIISKNKVLLSHSIQSFEKFLRKKQFISYYFHKPKVALLSKYHNDKRSFLTKIFGHFILPYGIDDVFLNTDINKGFANNSKQAIFTSRSDRNLDLLIKIWVDKIFPKYKYGNLLITPTKNFKENYKKKNIIFRKTGDRKNLIYDLCCSRMFLIPGHKAELYCLAAEEARELCLPIVTLGIGSLSERVIHNKTGFIAKNENEFSNYALEIFNDDNLWYDLRSNLINMRGEKNWDKSAKALLENV